MSALNDNSLESQLTITSNPPSCDLTKHFQNIASLGKMKFELDNYNYIPTIKCREKIELSCKNLKAKYGFDRFSLLIIYNQKKFWLSNTYYDFAIPHALFQLHTLDISMSKEFYVNRDHIYPTHHVINPIYDMYTKIINSIYNFYTIYTLERHCLDCRVLLYAGNSQPINNSLANLEKIYHDTRDEFENFALEVFDENIDSLTLSSNSIKYARIFYDVNFRKELIKNNFSQQVVPLTPQETNCLHWASLGKTADEIASIINISAHTVRQHLKNSINKLQANNVTHAVYIANSLGVI